MGAFKALGFNFLLKVYTLFLSNGTEQDSRLVISELFLISMKHCTLPLLSGIMSILYDSSLLHATFVSFIQLVMSHEISVTTICIVFVFTWSEVMFIIFW